MQQRHEQVDWARITYARVRVLRGLADNRTERQIADESGVAYSTVRSHVTTLKNLTVIWYDEKEAAWISIYPQLPAVSALASLRGCIREKTQANVGADRNLTGRIAFGCFPERPLQRTAKRGESGR